ncbi:tetratricopeptide repeat protein [Actinobacillus porcinus]|uniref:tetratricopeptide repeat protein n=1 Tax=Actinobacillus porcinus TaxID=51048 RepID=UPI002A90F897|nr:tetratricopeptide repeat protein [Actinobacillus porcinus]MDY5420593.1 tetratricopeptide repeat protein [Actinobacillus porcinus]
MMKALDNIPNYITTPINLLKKIADYGDINAQKMLGWHYLNGFAVSQDLKLAFYWNKKAALQRDPAAEFIVGWHYENNIGVELNYREAIKWYESSEKQGYLDAQIRLAELYFNGKDEPDDYQFTIAKEISKAINYAQMGAKKENTVAQRILGMSLLQNDNFSGILHLALASKKGDVLATETLAITLERYNQICRNDDYVMQVAYQLLLDFEYEIKNKLAPELSYISDDLKPLIIYFYHLAIKQGSLIAHDYLDRFYRRHSDNEYILRLKEKDDEHNISPEQEWKQFIKNSLTVNTYKSLQNAKQAAQDGEIEWQITLSDFYEYRDENEHIKWLKLLAESGEETSSYSLALVYEKQKNYSAALHWYRKSIDDPEAQERISYFYEHGLGVEQNEYLAYHWAKRAADNGSDDAKARLPELVIYSEM